MEIQIQLTTGPIDDSTIRRFHESASCGAWLEFRGIVRDQENGQRISALEYEAYSPMAENEMRRILNSLAEKFPCLAANIIHRTGIIPVGETAIYAGIAAQHRGEALSLLTEFMHRLKQDVPIWKRRGLPVPPIAPAPLPTQSPIANRQSPIPLDSALAEIAHQVPPLAAVRLPLADAFGHVLRETVSAAEDLPASDRSTRDGYAVLKNDEAEAFAVVDTLHAADWKPRQLKSGQAVRVATGSALPAENLRVIMQEHVERHGDRIKILRRESADNVRQRGEEMRAGDVLLSPGVRLGAGELALLATVGNARPLVSPTLQVAHFTTGDEVVPPDQTPKPGQIRDSNSILIRSALQKFRCDVRHQHLPEDFELAKSAIGNRQSAIENTDLLLVSSGASVGEKDFTRQLLESLGYQIIFNRVMIRPGAPLIFGVNGHRVAFGLPGNPLSHFVCFHLFVAAAIARLTGAPPSRFLRGILASKLDDAPNPRETLWPARWDQNGLTPLRWSSSGDVTSLKATNALVRVPPNRGSLDAGAEVDYLPTE